jgi:hypothetical protein
MWLVPSCKLARVVRPPTMLTAVRRDVMKFTAQRQRPEALNALSQPLYLKELDR